VDSFIRVNELLKWILSFSGLGGLILFINGSSDSVHWLVNSICFHYETTVTFPFLSLLSSA